MSSKSIPNRKKKTTEFEPVVNLAERQKYWAEAQKTRAWTQVWNGQNKAIILTEISKCDDPKGFFEIKVPKNFDWESFDLLDKKGEFFFDLSLPSMNLFFKTYFLNRDDLSIKFEFPVMLFKIQRRANARLRVPKSAPLKVELAQGKNDVIDISVSGMSFQVSPEQAKGYPVGKHLSDMKLTVRKKTHTLEGEVRNHTMNPEASVYISVMFTEISAKAVEEITHFIQEEYRKNYLKFAQEEVL